MAISHIQVRDARDRLIDILGIGQTYPLRDVSVHDEQLMVAFNTSAKVPIEPSQSGVVYQFYDKDDKPVERTKGVPASVEGNGETAIIETPKLQDDVTYSIRARKLQTGRAVRLCRTATIKVGLDSTLQAWIRDASLLEPTSESPDPTAARIISYGGRVTVELKNSQEGVDYRLVSLTDRGPQQDPEQVELSGSFLFQTTTQFSAQLDKERLPDDLRKVFQDNEIALSNRLVVAAETKSKTWMVTDRDKGKAYVVSLKADQLVVYSAAVLRGDLTNIILPTEAILEDTDIRIRAIKTFDPSENRATQTALLDIALPLKVRANTALQVSVDSAIVDFNKQAVVTVDATQRSASYGIFVRKIPDRDFVHGATSAADVVKVPVPGKPDAQIPKPEGGDAAKIPAGYTNTGDFQPGSGGKLSFTIPALTDDSMVIIQARKEHKATDVVTSSIILVHPAAILVRPNPSPQLKVQALAGRDPAAGAIQVSGGQPGVFYFFSAGTGGATIDKPAYFHKHDDDDPAINKGINQLNIEVDFVIAQDPASKAPDLTRTPPELPVLEIGAVQSQTLSLVRAEKAQTGVQIDIGQDVTIQPAG